MNFDTIKEKLGAFWAKFKAFLFKLGELIRKIPDYAKKIAGVLHLIQRASDALGITSALEKELRTRLGTHNYNDMLKVKSAMGLTWSKCTDYKTTSIVAALLQMDLEKLTRVLDELEGKKDDNN